MSDTIPAAPTAPTETRSALAALDSTYAAVQAESSAAIDMIAATAHEPATGPTILTYSQLAAFRNCRRMAFHGYEERLELIGDDVDSLRLGSIVHDAQETRDLAPAGSDPAAVALAVQASIDNACSNRAGDRSQQTLWARATGMLRAYIARWGAIDAEFTPFILANGKPAVEMYFEGPIINPATGARSRSFFLGGKVDEIVTLRADGRPWLLERKTTTTIDAGYLEKLWLDLQLRIYVHYLRAHVGIPVAGAIYDIIGKPGLKQGEGETEQEFMDRVQANVDSARAEMTLDVGETESEFAARHAEACAKSKSGKSAIKRKMPETDEEFRARVMEKVEKIRAAAEQKLPEPDDVYQARVAEWFSGKDLEPGKERFHREVVLFGDENIEELRDELWELTKQILDSRRRGVWYKNTSQCFAWNRACRFLALCRANPGSVDMLKANMYRVRPSQHPELETAGKGGPGAGRVREVGLVPGPF